MSLFRALHERWQVDPVLSALAPAARVFTGAAAADAALPYVVFEQTASAPLARTSSGAAIDRATIRARIWSESLVTGQAIVAALVARLERRDFALDDGRVLNVSLGDESHERGADGVWQLQLELHLTHLRTQGVSNHG